MIPRMLPLALGAVLLAGCEKGAVKTVNTPPINLSAEVERAKALFEKATLRFPPSGGQPHLFV